jgi:2-C-methyl-D-erythritol 4-phosphate cytidylyltransferase
VNIGVIFAGGAGKRMRSVEKPKQFLEIYNKPIIVYTLEHFENCREIDAVVIACLSEWIPYLEGLIDKYNLNKVKKIIPGGTTGQMSIYNGLCAAMDITDDIDKSIVLIHDGVRPLINTDVLTSNICCVRENGSAITAGIVKETIVVVDENNNVKLIPDRENSRVAKAPQSFWLKDVIEAEEKALKDGKDNFIDTCTLMQNYGYKMTMVDGPYENIKITTPDDFYMMRAILEAKENAQIYGIE